MLDHISTVANFTTRIEDEIQLTHPSETWKSALVQTVCVPDLDHIRIPSKITRKEDYVANGVLTFDLRQQIERQVEEAIRCAHFG